MLKRLTRWPLPGRLLAFVGLVLLVWLPVVAFLWPFLDGDGSIRSLATGILYLQFVGVLYFWGRAVRGEPDPWRLYGLQCNRRWGQEALLGWSLGVGALFGLLTLQASWGWLYWQSPPSWRVVGEGLALGVGVALAEELLFRGWLWQELYQDYGVSGAVWGSSGIFALAHFFHPPEVLVRIWPQFPGLWVLGLALAWGRLACGGRLGWPMGFHAGLVTAYYWVRVGHWLGVNPELPPWLTAVETNPLASPLGFVAMATVAWGTRRWADRRIHG